MARVAGVDLPREKRGEVAVTYIYGLGRSTGRRVLLKANVDKLVKINSFDGEVIVAKVHFVSEEDEDVIYDLVSTSRESQYEKLDQQPAYRIRFQDIESVEIFPSHPSRTGPTA